MRKAKVTQTCQPDSTLADPKRSSRRLLQVLRQFGRDRSGNYIVMAALAAPVLIGAAGLGTEAGYWMHQQQKMQDAADSAAFAAATYYGPNPDSVSTNGGHYFSNSATSVAATYGFVPTGVGVLNANSSITVAEPPTDGPNAGVTGVVEVKIQRSYPRMLSALFGQAPVVIRARAVAKSKGGYGCVLALDPTAAASASIQGTPNINLQSCSLYDDSNSSTAVSGGGSASLTALSVGVVGGISGAAHFTTTEGIWTGQSPTPDPYSDVNVPAFSGCDHSNFSSHKTETILPGVYCNGITLNGGANVTLSDGIYIIDRGSLQVNGNATLTGNHVTLVLTSSTGNNYPSATINGGATISLNPPNSGSLSGIVIYVDRNTPIGTSFKFNGGATQSLGGAVYVPTGAIEYAGGSNVSTVCTQIIGDTIAFKGNAVLAVSCTGFGSRMWGTGAKLAE